MAFATPASAFLTADDRDAPAAFAAPSDVDGSLSFDGRGRRVVAPLPASRVADALRERLPSAGGDPTVILPLRTRVLPRRTPHRRWVRASRPRLW